MHLMKDALLDTIIKVFVHMSCGYALEGTEG